MRGGRLTALVVGVVLAVWPLGAAPVDDPPVATVLAQVGEYLTGFATSYAQVVADEQ